MFKFIQDLKFAILAYFDRNRVHPFADPNPPFPVRAPDVRERPIQAHDHQSTHRSSVHKSTGESILRLKQKYYPSMTVPEIRAERVLGVCFEAQVVSRFLKANPSYQPLILFRQALYRMLSTPSYITEPHSKLTNAQILTLCIDALYDTKSYKEGVTFEDAFIAFINGVIEIEREYNMNSYGQDLGGESQPACFSGAVNKLIECLSLFHQDCFIKYLDFFVLNTIYFPRALHHAILNHLVNFDLISFEHFDEFAWVYVKRNLLKEIKAEFYEILCPSTIYSDSEKYDFWLNDHQATLLKGFCFPYELKLKDALDLGLIDEVYYKFFIETRNFIRKFGYDLANKKLWLNQSSTTESLIIYLKRELKISDDDFTIFSQKISVLPSSTNYHTENKTSHSSQVLKYRDVLRKVIDEEKLLKNLSYENFYHSLSM